MTPEQFLKDTIEYYGSDLKRRCVVKKPEGVNFCAYSPKTANLEGISEGCAIGRHLTPELKEKLDAPKANQNGPAGIIDLIKEPTLTELFPQWMRDMDVHFLSSVQNIHDVTNNWGEVEGLSSKGKFRVNDIIERFNLKMEKYEISDNTNSAVSM